MDETVLRISQGSEPVLIVAEVLRNLRGRFVWVRIDQPEADTVPGELVIQPAYFWSVAVGDGAVGPGEEEDKSPSISRLEGVNAMVIQILQFNLFGDCASSRGYTSGKRDSDSHEGAQNAVSMS